MKNVFKWIRIVSICLPKVVFDYFSYMAPYAAHPEKYPLELRYAKARKTILRILKHLKLSPVGGKMMKVDDVRGKLFVGNHLSFLDPLLLIAASEEPIGFVAKKEARQMPFVGKLITIINGCFIDRNDPIATLRAFKNLSKTIQSSNMGYAIFPEGTRNKFPYGMMGEFHPGAFKLAQMAGLDVVPFAQFGQQRILEEKKVYRSYPIQFRCLETIPKERIGELGTSEFATMVYRLIDVPVQEMIATDRKLMEEKAYKKKGPKWWKKEKVEEKEDEGEQTN